MNCLIGYTGFVGLNLQQYYKFDYFYNSKNFAEAKNKSFDTIFFCGMPAVKWYANKHPEEDYNILENIKSILDSVETKKIILISTIDVYDDVTNELDEDYEINYNKNHIYGRNRYLFEEYIKSRYNNYNIIRLPALFGKGLKKNIIYDLINNNNVNDIPVNSSFQWYCLDRLKKDIDIILENDIKICNLFPEPLHTKEIVKTFNEIFNINYQFQLEYIGNETIINYNLCSKYCQYFGNNKKYIVDNKEIIKDMKEYFFFERLDKSKLCISNICVNYISQIQFASILKLYGIKNIQIAPTKLIESWDNLKNIDLSIYKNLNINVYSFQSILYSLNHLNIFDKNTIDALYDHLIKVIDCAEKNNVKILVFGCPKNRQIINENNNNNTIFIDFFKKIGDYIENKEVKICLENNSKKYNCNFINTIDECSYFVRNIINAILR